MIVAFLGESEERRIPPLAATSNSAKLVDARVRLLAALDASAPAPKKPEYAPKDATVV